MRRFFRWIWARLLWLEEEGPPPSWRERELYEVKREEARRDG